MKLQTCLREAASAKAGRKPFIAQRWGAKPMKRNPFSRRPITHNFKRPHSKTEEPDPATAGFRRNPLSIMITTQSLRGGVGGRHNELLRFYSWPISLLMSFTAFKAS